MLIHIYISRGGLRPPAPPIFAPFSFCLSSYALNILKYI